MKRTIFLLILIFFSTSAFASNEAEIRKTVNQYLDARSNRDSNQAGSLIARESLQRFEWMRQQALHADRKSLCNMTLSEVTRILVIRSKYHRILAKIDARALAGAGLVDQSLMEDGPREFQITDVTSDTAIALLPDPLSGRGHQQIDLVREGDKWRMRLSMGAGGAAEYDPFWQQQKKEKGCDAALTMALDLIDRKKYTQLLDPIE